ncbi:hypothetical protein JS520_00075 [Candidatus Vidania fulgoroideae]|nr:hypothetical protein JS520_00075 [Candidatus Vidania fulgoroideae]
MLNTLTVTIKLIKLLLSNHYYYITIIITNKTQIKTLSKKCMLKQCNGHILTFIYDTPKIIINSLNVEILINKNLKNDKYILYMLSTALAVLLHKTRNTVFKILYFLNRSHFNKHKHYTKIKFP